jgi:TctA family transporter
MESLALLVSIIILAIFSSAFVAVALSFSDSKVARTFVFIFAPLSSAAGLWLGFAAKSTGSWVMGLIVVGLGVFSLWNSNRNR